MADKQGAQSPKGSLSEQKAGPDAAGVKARKPRSTRTKHPAGADIEAKKTRAQQREDQAAERRAGKADEFGTVSNPSLAQQARDEDLEQVREINERHREEFRYHGRTEIEHEIRGVPDSSKKDDDGGVLLLSSAGGRVYVSCSRKEVVLDHDGMADFVRYGQRLFQAVS